MKKVVKIVTETESIDFGHLVDEDGEWKSLLDMDEEEIKQWAKELKCSPELLYALSAFIYELRESVENDLVSLWNEIEKLKKEMEG